MMPKCTKVTLEGRKGEETGQHNKNEGNFVCFPKLENFVDALSPRLFKMETTSVMFGSHKAGNVVIGMF